MNDIYCEYIVKRKMGVKALICRYFVVIATVLAFYYGLMLSQFYGAFFGMLLVFFGMLLALLCLYVFRNTNLEYEYQFISGSLDIDVIFARAKRKRARKFDMRAVEVFALADSDVFKQYEHMKADKAYREVDYSSGYPDRKKHAFIISIGEKGVAKVIFEPNEKMVEAIRQYIPSKMRA